MILNYKENNGKNSCCFLDCNKTRASICLDDLLKFYLFEKNVLRGTSKIFDKREKSIKYFRINVEDYFYKIYVKEISYCCLKDFTFEDNGYYFAVNLSKGFFLEENGEDNNEQNEEDVYLILKLSQLNIERTEKINEKLVFVPIKVQPNSTRDCFIFSVRDKFKDYFYGRDETNIFLSNWRCYNELKLHEATLVKNVVASEIDIEEFRENYEFWTSLTDDGKVYFPINITSSIRSLNSIMLVANKHLSDGIHSFNLLDNKMGVKFKVLNREKLEEFKKDILENNNYNIETNVGYIQFEDNADVDELFNKLLDRNIDSITIKQNVIGEIERIARIIEGIDSVLNLEVVNKKLVNQIINNTLKDNNNFKVDEKAFANLKRNYPKLNDEQILTILKIINMDSLLLVQGPPGTGKTEIISALTKELDKDNKRVLLTSNVGEARRNIINRIKGEKELIIKQFTTVNENKDTYAEEVKFNKINYINNQIVEKFTFDDEFIYTKAKYEKILDDLKDEKDKLNALEKLNCELQNKNIESKVNTNSLDLIHLTRDNLEKEKNNIYKLIINDDLENIPNNIFGNTIDKFLELFNATILPEEVNKVAYAIKKDKEIKNLESLEEKVDFFLKYDLSNSKLEDSINVDFLKQYNSVSNLKKWLFKFSNVFSCFSINNKNINDLNNLILENENNIKKINYFDSKNAFELLVKDFHIYLDSLEKQLIKKEEEINYDIEQLERKIIEEQNNNFGLRQKVSKYEEFVNSYEFIKNKYPNEMLFYTYLNDLNKIINLSKDKNSESYYLDCMLSDYDFENEFKYNNINDGSIISMSTSQVAAYLKKINIDFDYIIVDEASKCNINDLIVSLSKTKKMVLIGDYLQLDPFEGEKDWEFISEEEWNRVEASPFSQMIKPIVDERFINNNFDYSSSNLIGILKKQYRMSKEIFGLVEKIYKAVPGFELVDGKKEFVNPNLKYKNILSVQCDGVERTDEDDTSSYNDLECECILNILNKLKETAMNENLNKIKKVGIISFYRRQSIRIGLKISKLKRELSKLNISVEVGTVDSFQGREFDLVLLSCVRTEKITSHLTKIRRWNVSVSRAKDKLIVIGNFNKLFDLASNKQINVYDSQDSKEEAVIYSDIIPYFYHNKEQYSTNESFNNKVVNFLMGGTENE